MISVLKRTELVQLWLKMRPAPRSGPSKHSLAANNNKLKAQIRPKAPTSAMCESTEVDFPASRASETLNGVVPVAKVEPFTALVLHGGARDPVLLVKAGLSPNKF